MISCQFCKSSHVTEHEENEVINYQGSELSILMIFSICDQCDREFISKQQILANEARIRDAKKSHDGLMTSDEIFKARVSLNLTQEQASLVFGGGKNAFSKYERAEVSQSIAMDTLIRVCLKHPDVLQELLVSRKIELKVPVLKYENIINFNKPVELKNNKNSATKVVTINEASYG